MEESDGKEAWVRCTAAGWLARKSPWQVAALESRCAGPRDGGHLCLWGCRECWGAGPLVVGMGKQSRGSPGRMALELKTPGVGGWGRRLSG